MARKRIEAFLTDLLPAGDFWTTAAVQTFIRAMARAFEPAAQVVEGLRDAIFPGSAEREILLQWWEYIRSRCTITPADTEDLRTAVLSAISSPPGHTFAGLQELVRGQGLGFVQLRHKLPIANIPTPVPFAVNPHARILEAWNPPLIHSPERVRCIVRDFSQSADFIRYLEPEGAWRAIGPTAHDTAFIWRNVPNGRVRARRVFVADDPRQELEFIIGAPVTRLWLGNGQVLGAEAGETFITEGDAAFGVTGPELGSGSFLGTDTMHLPSSTDALVHTPTTVGDMPADESVTFICVVHAPSTIPSDEGILSKSDLSVAPRGWLLKFTASGAVFFRLDPAGGANTNLATVDPVSPGWRVLVAQSDRTANIARLATDTEATVEAPAPDPALRTDTPEVPLRVGDSSNGAGYTGHIYFIAELRGDAAELEPHLAARAIASALQPFDATFALPGESGIKRASEVLGITSDEVLSGTSIEWAFDSDFGQGPIPVTPAQTITIAQEN